jgi:hypothetical protein
VTAYSQSRDEKRQYDDKETEQTSSRMLPDPCDKTSDRPVIARIAAQIDPKTRKTKTQSGGRAMQVRKARGNRKSRNATKKRGQEREQNQGSRRSTENGRRDNDQKGGSNRPGKVRVTKDMKTMRLFERNNRNKQRNQRERVEQTKSETSEERQQRRTYGKEGRREEIGRQSELKKATKNKRGTQSITNEKDKTKTQGRETKKLKKCNGWGKCKETIK